MNEWLNTTLGEVVTFQRGFDLPKKDRTSGIYPIMVSNGQDGTHNEFKVKAPGIITGRSGTLGNIFYVDKDFWPLNTTLWIKDFYNNDVKFVYYFLKVFPLEKYNSGSGVPTLNRNHIHPLPVTIPPLQEQKAIANILTSFDDKIELLQQQNQTLETLAQTIFKEWFGKYQIGDKLPEGWIAGKLGDIAINHSKTFKFTKDKVVFVNTGDVLEGEFLHANEISPIGLPGQAKKVIELHDILYSEIRPKNKRFAFVDFDTSNYVVSTKFMIIRPKRDFSPFILYLILKNQDTINEFNLIAESRSGTFPQITFDSVKEFPVVIPTIEAQRKCEAILKPIMEKQRVNKEQIQTLTKTRDVLLPKLMSGEIRVKYK